MIGKRLLKMQNKSKTKESIYKDLERLGIIESEDVRDSNVGTSNYSKHIIQPWSIWLDYDLNP